MVSPLALTDETRFPPRMVSHLSRGKEGRRPCERAKVLVANAWLRSRETRSQPPIGRLPAADGRAVQLVGLLPEPPGARGAGPHDPSGRMVSSLRIRGTSAHNGELSTSCSGRPHADAGSDWFRPRAALTTRRSPLPPASSARTDALGGLSLKVRNLANLVILVENLCPCSPAPLRKSWTLASCRIISFVPTLAAVNSTISARQTRCGHQPGP